MITDAIREDLFATHSGQVVFTLLTFEHPDLEEPIRITTNPMVRLTTEPLVYGLISRGEEYVFLPASIVLPPEGDKAVPRYKIDIDNVDRSMTEIVRSIQGDAIVIIEVMSSLDLENPIRPGVRTAVRSASITATRISLEVVGDPLITEPFPGVTFTSDRFPGLF